MEFFGTLRKVEEDDLLDLYGKAVACAVLGKISPQRTRVLLLLQKVIRVIYSSVVRAYFHLPSSVFMFMFMFMF